MSEKRQQSSMAKLNQMSPAASSQKPNEHTQRIDHQLSDVAPEQSVVPISPASESEAPFNQDGIANSRTSRAELPSQEAPQLPHSGDDVAAGRLPSTLDPTVTLAMVHPVSATAGGGTERRKKRSSSVSLSRKKAKPFKQGRDRGVSLTSTERRALKPPVFVVQSPTLDNKQTLEEGSDPKTPPSCKTSPTLVRSGTTRLTNVSEQPPLPAPSDVQCSDSSQPYSRLGQRTTASKREFQTSPVRRVSQTAPQTAVSPSSTRRLGLESPAVREPYGPAVSMNRQKSHSQMQPSRDGADNAAAVVASSPQSQPVRRTISRSEMAPASPKEDAAYGTPLLGPRYITKRQSTASFHSFAPQTSSAHGTQLELSKSDLRAGAAVATEDPLLKASVVSGTMKILSPPPSSPKSVAPSLSRSQLTQQGKAGSSSTILNPEGAQTNVRVSVIQEPSLRSGISPGGPVDVSKAATPVVSLLEGRPGSVGTLCSLPMPPTPGSLLTPIAVKTPDLASPIGEKTLVSPAVSLLEGRALSEPDPVDTAWCSSPSSPTAQASPSQRAPIAAQAPVVTSSIEERTAVSPTPSLLAGGPPFSEAGSFSTWYGVPRSPTAMTPMSQHTPSPVQSPVFTSPDRQLKAREYKVLSGLREMAHNALQLPGALSRRSGDRLDKVVNLSPAVTVPVCLLSIVALVAALVLLRLLWSSAGQVRRGKRCETYACREHASELGAHREHEPTAEPCEDFGRFVCSGWPRKYKIALSVREQAIVDWVNRVVDPARSQPSDVNRTPSITHRALTMVSACMSPEKVDNTDILVKFMRSQGLAFPDEQRPLKRASYREQLRTLAVLAVHWRLPLWFDLKLVTSSRGPGETKGKRMIYVTPSSLAYMFNRMHIRLIKEALHDSYARSVSSTVFNDEAWQGGLLERSAYVQSSILGNLSEASLETTRSSAEPWLGDVKHLARFVTQLDPDDWRYAFQSAFDAEGAAAVSPPISLDDPVFLSDARLLNTIESLLVVHPPSDIAAHTSWWVAQVLSPLAYQAVIDFVRATEFFGAMVHALMCAMQVESVYNVLLAVLDRHRLTTETRSSVVLLFERLRSVAMRKLATSYNLDGTVRATFAEVAETAQAVVWPENSSDDRSEDVLLRDLYGHAEPRSDDDFVQRWLSSRRDLRRSLGTAARDIATSVFNADYVSMASYDPFRRLISLWTVALEAPYYAEGGTSAMHYGGLGFLFARELFRLADVVTATTANDSSVTRRWTAGGSLWDGDGDNSSAPAAECLEEGVFPDLPALETAYAAYLQYRRLEYDAPLSGMDNYTPEQVFFMTACHTFCRVDHDGAYEPDRCTVTMKNFRPFAAAFDCVHGSPMYPSKRCQFF